MDMSCLRRLMDRFRLSCMAAACTTSFPAMAYTIYRLMKTPCEERHCGWLQDMRQVWENCFKFNQKDGFVGKIGSKADEKFEQLWAGSGYDQGGRRRRVTGGVAAHRYEPDLLEAEPKASLPRRTSSGGRSSRRVSTRPPPLALYRSSHCHLLSILLSQAPDARHVEH